MRQNPGGLDPIFRLPDLPSGGTGPIPKRASTTVGHRSAEALFNQQEASPQSGQLDSHFLTWTI